MFRKSCERALGWPTLVYEAGAVLTASIPQQLKATTRCRCTTGCGWWLGTPLLYCRVMLCSSSCHQYSLQPHTMCHSGTTQHTPTGTANETNTAAV